MPVTPTWLSTVRLTFKRGPCLRLEVAQMVSDQTLTSPPKAGILVVSKPACDSLQQHSGLHRTCCAAQGHTVSATWPPKWLPLAATWSTAMLLCCSGSYNEPEVAGQGPSVRLVNGASL